MKRIFLLVTFFSIILSVSAQKSKREAKEILDQVSDVVTKGKNFEVQFSLVTYVGESVQGVANGKLLLKDDKFTCETEDMKTWYDGNTQWSLIYDSEEVNVTNPTPEELVEINPYALLRLYKKGYAYHTGEQKVIEGVPFVEVILTAKVKDSNFDKITLWVNTKSYEPHTIDIVRSNGDLIHINIDSVMKQENISDRLFAFDSKQYPNVDVIDLR